MTPQTNDAYNGSLRDIVFPAGILKPPIFDRNADAAMNYGGWRRDQLRELTCMASTTKAARSMRTARCAIGGQPDRRWRVRLRARKALASAGIRRLEPLPGVHINGEHPDS